MEEHVKNNIIRILDKTIEAIKKENIKELKELSNETIDDATVYQDEYSITLAVLIYSLSKFYEREMHYSKFKGWKSFCFDCFRALEIAREKLIENDYKNFDSFLKKYVSNLNKHDSKLNKYIGEVFRKAKINKASRLYEHGLSVGRTAELLGITRFELMDYIGKTGIADMDIGISTNAVARLKFARGLFK